MWSSESRASRSWPPEWRQHALKLVAHALQPRRQLQVGAQFVQRLVDRKARRVGGDLKQHATRLPEVDRMKVLAIDDRSYVQPLCGQLLAQHKLRDIVAGTEGHMVNGACRHHAAPEARRTADVDNC